jgi:hypothetical protein
VECLNPLAELIRCDPVNAIRFTLGVSLGCARFNFAEPRAELILVDDGNPEQICFLGFYVPRLMAGNRQCNENRSCRGQRNHCRIVEETLKHAQLVRAVRTRISPHLCARSELGGFLNGEMQGMTVAWTSHTTHKPRNLLPVPLCPPQIDQMIEAFPQT